jgi:hypothetical protein
MRISLSVSPCTEIVVSLGFKCNRQLPSQSTISLPGSPTRPRIACQKVTRSARFHDLGAGRHRRRSRRHTRQSESDQTFLSRGLKVNRGFSLLLMDLRPPNHPAAATYRADSQSVCAAGPRPR